MNASRKRKSEGVGEDEPKRTKLSDPVIKLELEWKEEGRLKEGLPLMFYLDSPKIQHSSKVAAFDIDGTVIRTKSGKTFPTGVNDWMLFSPSVPRKLRELHGAGTKIVFFTNQAGLEKGKEEPKSLLGKFEDIVNEIGVPIQVFVCPGHCHYRKPGTEMWQFMAKNCNGGEAIDLKESIYVGDAAGRAKGWAPGKSKDFSASDRMFAANIGVQFATPDKYFLGKAEVPFQWGSLNPKAFLDSIKSEEPPARLHSDNQEMVVVVGRPASGKTTLREHYFTQHGYVAVNRDTLGTQQRCIRTAKDSLTAGKSVIIDNTNPSSDSRKPYINLAKDHKVPVRCLFIDIPQELSKHLNMYRQNKTKGKTHRIPPVAFNTYEKNFEKPQVEEGFSEVKIVHFIPKFNTSADEELFKQWTCM